MADPILSTSPVTDNTATPTQETILPEMHLDKQTTNSQGTQEPASEPATTDSVSDLPQINEELAIPNLEPVIQLAETVPVVEASTEPITESIPQINAMQTTTVTNEDPFAWLNIVFDKPKESIPSLDANQSVWNEVTTSVSTIGANLATNGDINNVEAVSTAPEKEIKEFVDPFLNPKAKPEVTTPTVESMQSMEQTASTAQGTANPNQTTNPENVNNLDALLTTIDTPVVAIADPKTLTSKKKKFLMMTSAGVGVMILVAASYMVFTTMYPQETNDLAKNLQWDISWPNTTTTPETTATETKDNTYQPSATDTKTSEPQVKEEELAPVPEEDTSANSFGKEDELPSTPKTETSTPNTDTSSETSTTTTPDDAETVAPEVKQALDTITNYVDKCKQFLALAKEKNDTASIKAIAGILKSIREVKSKIDTKTYTTYSTDIEKPLSEINFNLDQIGVTLITK